MVSVSPAVPNRSKRPSNKKSMLLSDEENYALFRLLTERNSVTLASGVVQVLKAEPTRHMWRRIAVGVGCVVKDFKECSYFIRVYDLLNDSVCFEQRLYDEFHAIQPSQTLITFEGDQCRIGLNFASPDEAQFFHGKLDRKRQRDIEDRDQKRRALTQQNGRAESNVYHSQANTNNANRGYSNEFIAYRNGPESMNEQNVFGMASTRAKKPRKKGKGAKLKKEDISKPVPDSFSHKFHVGFDPHKGMQTSGAGEDLDPVIFNFLKSAGKDPTRMSRNAMNEVYQIIDSKGGVDQLKMEMEQKKMSSPQRPAYPPAPSQKQAPPPANSRSMPPPPPPRTDSIASPAATRPGPPPPPSAYPSRGPPPPKQSLPPQPTRPPGGPPPPPPPPTAKPHKQMAPPPPRAAPVRAPAAVGGGPPPPPAPPPPPPILVSDAPKGVPAENSGRADLMAAIRGHGGTNNMQHMPDPMDKRSSGGSSDGRDALLGEIRQGPKLKHVDPNAPRPPPPPEAGGGGMMEALTRALQSRREGIAPSDSDSDEESESSSDGGWSDEDL